MKKVIRIDYSGMFVEDVILNLGDATPSDCTEIMAPEGFLHPKLVGGVWVEGKDASYVLSHLKGLKLDQIQQAYAQNLLDGFPSSCTGPTLIYDYNEESQKVWVEMFASLTSNFIPDTAFPMNITIKSGTVVPHTKLQLQQLGSGLTVWKFQLHGKYQAITNVNGTIAIATTLSAVSAITW